MRNYPTFRVATANVAPIFLGTPATVDKVCALVEEVARHGARLIAFPESYIPTFPVWLALRAPIHNATWRSRLRWRPTRCSSSWTSRRPG